MSSIRIRSKLSGNKVQIRILIAHPMENGRNRDPETEKLIPAHFIQELVLSHNDQPVIQASLGGSISKNPFFTFVLKNARAGDKITVSWIDNQGISDTRNHFIKPI